MALTWADIVDVKVDIVVTYNIGAGDQQAQANYVALNVNPDWKLEKFDQGYRTGTCDMATDLAGLCVGAIWNTVGELRLVELRGFASTVTLTYIKGTTKEKQRPVLLQGSHVNAHVLSGNYQVDAIQSPVTHAVQTGASAACDLCITDAGG